MTISVSPCESLSQGLKALRQALQTATLSADSLTRVEVPLPSTDILAWLRSQQSPGQGYWCNRDRSFTLGGIGRADVICGERAVNIDEVVTHINRVLGDNSHARYFGGMAFMPPPYVDDSWHRFGSYRFVLPRLEMTDRSGTTTLALNILPDDRHDASLHAIDAMLANVNTNLIDADPQLPTVVSQVASPDFEGWASMLSECLADIVDDRLEKVVLARKIAIELQGACDPLDVMWKLRESEPSTLQFCFQPAPDQCFIGASPELLFHKAGRELYTEAIAGTRKRCEDAVLDASLADDLMSQTKDRREHRIVVEAILDRLASLKATGRPESPRILKLTQVQHKHTPIHATLPAETKTSDLLSALHPTPAVGGNPRDKALSFIQGKEPFDRGWFASPVGWISKDAAEFTVAIRSALVEGDRMSLFSGAGIVEGSKVEDEWDEINNKVAHIMSLFEKARDE